MILTSTSITFTYVVAKAIGVDNNFVYFYLTIALTGFIAAIIMPYIPWLSRKPDTYHSRKIMLDEGIPDKFKWVISGSMSNKVFCQRLVGADSNTAVLGVS